MGHQPSTRPPPTRPADSPATRPPTGTDDRFRAVVRRFLVAVILLHGLIHFLGAAKGFEWAEVAQLKAPISGPLALAWLIAGCLVVLAAVMVALGTRWWWFMGAVAAVASQAVIATSWADAKAGTALNFLLLLVAGYGYASQGPRSFHAEFDTLTAVLQPSPSTTRDFATPGNEPVHRVVTEADLGELPDLVAAYVRRSGAVGQARVSSFRATFHGKIRSGPDSAWMTFTGEQRNTYGEQPSRIFTMDASMKHLPVDVLHVYVGGRATMRVKAMSVVGLVNASGAELNRAETVTVFNDLCVLAPAALVDAPISWMTLDDSRVRGAFTTGGQTVVADLTFNADHELTDFVSDDRATMNADQTLVPRRWSTPVSGYRSYGSARLPSLGMAQWHDIGASFTYLEFHLDEVYYA